ncbi:MAG: tail fiber domain-containing protein [Deltaproteobacteria bacterium]|nr:tail fiber domain-containing protein [Deltaproteobacteria bacterium]
MAIHKGRAVPLRASLYVRGEGHEVAGVSYEWKREEYPDWGFKDSRQIGLLAQDVERVIPELVSADETGYKAVSYNKLTAVLVEAVKELKAENERLRKRLKEETLKQQSQIDELRALIVGSNSYRVSDNDFGKARGRNRSKLYP